MLKYSIINRIKDFYIDGFDENGWIVSDRYEKAICKEGKKLKNIDIAIESLNWLKDRNAIDDSDISTFKEIRKIRNKLVHEMPSVIQKFNPMELSEPLEKITYLLRKIEIWWIKEVEIEINPYLDNIDVDQLDLENILPGNILLIGLMQDILLGTEDEPV